MVVAVLTQLIGGLVMVMPWFALRKLRSTSIRPAFHNAHRDIGKLVGSWNGEPQRSLPPMIDGLMEESSQRLAVAYLLLHRAGGRKRP